ncbi:glycosyltransferase [Rhodobacteraceae bacterium HSP-20]|uniref:Glycosyltransferase n=1 Tax=Paragemmobacter amnigenus TaxID=2852097 RepID=A0ABS6J421_9RHOB|nr:glycosyltransferase [Rhodobacter amnigenus]MBU9698237.1 glycosyltransferase [Rhodobacter amnigenus]MBV4389464.1 glycosyltransferase [Rhodobacter amnigenus]
MKNEPLLTIGLPVYNGEQFLREALDSVLSQSFSEFVLIISDNCSTDNTLEILQAYAAMDNRIRLKQQAANIGAVENFRFVFDNCETEYFCWAAADDLLDKYWIEKLLQVAQQEPCLAFGTIQTIDSAGKYLNHPANHRSFNFVGAVPFRRIKYFISPGLLGKANPIYGIFRKADLKDEFWTSFKSTSFGMDVAALYRLLESMPIRSRTDTCLYKRRHQGNEAVNPTQIRRKPFFRKTMFLVFLSQSTWLERLLLVLAYPIAAFGVFYAKFAYLIMRAIERSTRNRT